MIRLMGNVANAHGVLRAKGLRRSLAGVLADEIMIVHIRMTQKITGDIAIVSRFVLDAFGRRAIAAIEIA